uniref:Uncharacterized protein n=1 Tax=Nymphaea colorata TaxID=210225 RepID=A0A5K0Y0W1_9MAGN
MDQPANQTVTFRMVSKDEEGKKRVEKKEVDTHDRDTLRYLQKKMVDKGLQRMERHPRDGLSLDPPPPKAGHGGKFTWEGPADIAENELSAPAAIDEGDPNYVDDRREAEAEAEAVGLVVGEVDVAKATEVKEGVSRIEVRPPL